ncbi:PAS domain-containing protein [Hwanghaeella sp.]|uniref:PAS domain-containing protein n=1 Tax=Hwanghaeella sp. TaxID=2605943 RepID=UPI003CCBE681
MSSVYGGLGAGKPAFGPVLFEAEGEGITEHFMSDCLRQLFAKWQDYRAGEALPHEDRIDPLDFFRWLPNTMLVDVEERDGLLRFLVRLNGETHVSIAGQNMVGQRFDEIPSVAKDEGMVISVFQQAARSRQPHYWRRKFINPAMRWNSYERCLLPFVDDAGAVSTLLAVAQVLLTEK